MFYINLSSSRLREELCISYLSLNELMLPIHMRCELLESTKAPIRSHAMDLAGLSLQLPAMS